MLRFLTLLLTIFQLALAPVQANAASNPIEFSTSIDQGIDGAVSAGVSSAIYGTSFSDSFLSSLSSSVVGSFQADVQNAIGANFDAGSIENILSHVAVSCATSSLTGADCHAGVVGALVEQAYVNALDGDVPAVGTPEYDDWKAEHSKALGVIAAAAGYLVSGGSGENVNTTSSYAVSALENNYLTQVQLDQLKQAFLQCQAEENPTACRQSAWSTAKLQSEENFAALEACDGVDWCVEDHIREILAGEERRNEIASLGWNTINNTIENNRLAVANELDYTEARAFEYLNSSEFAYWTEDLTTLQDARKMRKTLNCMSTELCVGNNRSGDKRGKKIPGDTKSDLTNPSGKKVTDPVELEAANRTVSFDPKQIQKKYTKHAEDFGVTGNYNKVNAEKFQSAVDTHIKSPDVKPITGTYRGDPVTHYVDPKTGLNAMKDPAGNFISGWKLNPAQLKNVIERGKL